MKNRTTKTSSFFYASYFQYIYTHTHKYIYELSVEKEAKCVICEILVLVLGWWLLEEILRKIEEEVEYCNLLNLLANVRLSSGIGCR